MKRIKEIFIIFTCLLMWAVLLGGWSYTLKTSTPAGGDDPREADNRMREIKAAFVERLDIDHYFEASATSTYDAADTGMHRYVTYQAPISTPATIAASQGRTYIKDVSSVAELHWIDENEAEVQITRNGEIEYQSISDVNNNTYIVAIDAAGTGTANLIKADANDNAVLPDGAELATSVAPDANEGIANKKYVDDQVAGADPDDDAFGSWASKNNNESYEAASDGFVCAYTTSASNIIGYTDGDNPPATIRQRGPTSFNDTYQSLIFPVRKGDFWKVVGAHVVFWLPIGA